MSVRRLLVMFEEECRKDVNDLCEGMTGYGVVRPMDVDVLLALESCAWRTSADAV